MRHPRRPTASSNLDYYGVTTNLSWISGDSSPRTVSIPLTNNGTVAASKQFRVMLSNPTQNGTNQPGLFYAGSPGSITTATLTISNDNSYGAFQFSAPSYVVRENGGYATITVLRTGGIAGPISVTFYTGDGRQCGEQNQLLRLTNGASLCRQPDRHQRYRDGYQHRLEGRHQCFLFQRAFDQSRSTRRWVC